MSDTSVRAAARIMAREGHPGEYVWSGSADEIRTWVRTKRPLVFPTRWFESMYEPDRNGYVYPKGRVVDGHTLCTFGVEENGDVRIQQSLGPNHGVEGCIRKSRMTLSYLVSRGCVSACAAAQIPQR